MARSKSGTADEEPFPPPPPDEDGARGIGTASVSAFAYDKVGLLTLRPTWLLRKRSSVLSPVGGRGGRFVDATLLSVAVAPVTSEEALCLPCRCGPLPAALTAGRTDSTDEEEDEEDEDEDDEEDEPLEDELDELLLLSEELGISVVLYYFFSIYAEGVGSPRLDVFFCGVASNCTENFRKSPHAWLFWFFTCEVEEGVGIRHESK